MFKQGENRPIWCYTTDIMTNWLTKFHRRDFGVSALILANFFCLGGFLVNGIQTATEPTGGWRRINLKALTAQINAGELVNKEAEWYRPVDDHKGKNTASGRPNFLEGKPHDN
jgi:hypothetical protein